MNGTITQSQQSLASINNSFSHIGCMLTHTFALPYITEPQALPLIGSGINAIITPSISTYGTYMFVFNFSFAAAQNTYIWFSVSDTPYKKDVIGFGGQTFGSSTTNVSANYNMRDGSYISINFTHIAQVYAGFTQLNLVVWQKVTNGNSGTWQSQYVNILRIA